MSEVKKKLLLFSIMTTMGLTILSTQKKETYISSVEVKKVTDNETIKQYLKQKKISFQDVKNVLEQNSNLSLWHKEQIQETLDLLEKKYLILI